MTLKLLGFIAATLLSAALAAPAVVWKKQPQQVSPNDRSLHSSESLSASGLLENVLLTSEAPQPASLSAVVFLVGKGEDGSEQLTELASSGSLPLTSQKYGEAAAVHHHISGLESSSTVVRDATKNGKKVAQVSLHELSNKLSALSAPTEMEIDSTGSVAATAQTTSKTALKREREISRADVLIVTVNAKRDAAELDASISSTIDSPHVASVVLAGIRSIDEVKHERYLASKRRMTAMEQEGQTVLDARTNNRRRRLEQEEQQGDAAGDDAVNNGNNGDDMSGVYYVYMTPNIFAGLLFGLLFIVVTFIGVSCMGAIQGQDTFVTKMPSIGREA